MLIQVHLQCDIFSSADTTVWYLQSGCMNILVWHHHVTSSYYHMNFMTSDVLYYFRFYPQSRIPIIQWLQWQQLYYLGLSLWRRFMHFSPWHSWNVRFSTGTVHFKSNNCPLLKSIVQISIFCHGLNSVIVRAKMWSYANAHANTLPRIGPNHLRRKKWLLAQDRPWLTGPSTFARLLTLRTVQFDPFGSINLNLTVSDSLDTW